MNGLMMDFQLTLPTLMRRAETLFGDQGVVSRLPDRSFHTTTFRDVMRRSKQLATALDRLGIERGDRVATLCWNHSAHLEAYYGVPSGGYVLHTLNLRLHPDDIGWIAKHAGDRVVIVDRQLLPLLDQFRDQTAIEEVFVVEDSYEELLATGDAEAWRDPELDEKEAAAMCYTSGTTGRPKGVVYSHRSTVLHALGVASTSPLGLRIGEGDTICPVVPMFHANAWGYPYLAAITGSRIVFPGPYLDPESLLETLTTQNVSWSAGVPTLWLGMLQLLDDNPGKWDLSHMVGMLVGGSAVPRSMIAAYKERHGLDVVQGWGMTETSPVASVTDFIGDLRTADQDTKFDYAAMAGYPLAFVEIRVMSGSTELPWDGEAMGELEVRGPWVAASYYQDAELQDRWTEDGWFRTGDIVSVEPRGFIQIKDRAKDVIKSGGEWISSVELENKIMAHPAVAEAAVIAIADPKWAERPLAAVVLKPGESLTEEQLREFLSGQCAKWWVPDRFEFIDEIPKTAVGKFKKTALRDMFATAGAEEEQALQA
ncbi:MAG TPA: long-chain fatty acid--CoA ligase [Gaiellaceae bacterium]|nr:long-chain fatty acid--CoA ligase [Gaiellaceae bacterium]